mmetsp:Transcript_27862/g.60043  ORF Transcript_27862/g.60043 Transcript_27862/m.60043 type:complete len:254 (-) Transcript_27862:329-1090(-)
MGRTCCLLSPLLPPTNAVRTKAVATLCGCAGAQALVCRCAGAQGDLPPTPTSAFSGSMAQFFTTSLSSFSLCMRLSLSCSSWKVFTSSWKESLLMMRSYSRHARSNFSKGASTPILISSSMPCLARNSLPPVVNWSMVCSQSSRSCWFSSKMVLCRAWNSGLLMARALMSSISFCTVPMVTSSMCRPCVVLRLISMPVSLLSASAFSKSNTLNWKFWREEPQQMMFWKGNWISGVSSSERRKSSDSYETRILK